MTNPVDRFVDAIQSGAYNATDAFAEDALVDATVPNWRFVVRGARAIDREFSQWFGHPASFNELRRTPLPDGELLEYTLAWTEDGVVHQSHQSHHLTVCDGKIVSDIAWCGGRWPASLLKEMGRAV